MTTTSTATAPATAAPRPSAAQRRAHRLTARILERLAVGRITLVTPDGRTEVHGDPAAELAADLVVHDWGFFTALVHGGSAGAGESWMASQWSSSDLVTLVRIVIANRRAFRAVTPTALLHVVGDRAFHAVRANRVGRSKRNIADHYDLSNELYALFLDPTMTYSCAYFDGPERTLEEAQVAKWERIADKARLGPGQRVLEVGCGWGGFAIHVARTRGCHVTGITLSEEQAAYARRAVEEAGLTDLIDVRIVDYRHVEGTFDRVVSIEMLEAVGHRFLGTYFATIDRLLGPDGLAVVQVITIPEQRERAYRRRPDFIQRHIFPGGHLPSLASMTAAMGRASGLRVEHVENIGTHYAETLRRWRERFLANAAEVRALGFDEAFLRMWEFYLAYCEGAFLARYIDDLQLVLARPMNATLGTAPYAGAHVPVAEADLPGRRAAG